ncbi:P(E)-nerolidol/(E,E)-geranyl linalool synthase [Dorcoceras hygrometricum]|uniref:P(E)-nerolidol/(E,E)-geranyl linalool synthase n=1 Tax=Dorcoceras hygrometricum TaxID=472368 RepID=A0A2Z7CW45_9LAMI|nr:P(E)-nerolidol/(E,E)-geranyl linalool synthase [Dorcoceras hygrometricum]
MQENPGQFISAMYSVFTATDIMKFEVDVPWTALLDHLNHRKWIEQNNMSPLWVGKASFYRFSCLDNKNLAQLAVENYEFRQSIYRQELEEMKRWSEKCGLSEMGFGRNKTEYTYYAVAACSCHPFNSIMRKAMAKAATIVTIADDFYDIEGSVSELRLLTKAIRRAELPSQRISTCSVVSSNKNYLFGSNPIQ